MRQSAITSKNQTTIPKEIRDQLGIGRGDVLIWEVDNDGARVRRAQVAFLRHRGTVKVGAGSPVEDVRLVRQARGADRGSVER